MHVVTSPPNQEPVSLDEAKDWLRVGYDAEDALIEGLIMAARAYCEHYTNRIFLHQTLVERFEAGERQLTLHADRITSVTSVKVGTRTLDPTEYTADDRLSCTVIVLNLAPATAPIVTYEAGAASYKEVSPAIKAAMKLLIADMYENRVNMVRNLPTAAHNLLNTQRRWLT
ncbi:head-tail connector protein [Neolewinella antarctica]|uniref:PhiE125 gp8 family phage protein n=1 Tax=Neolewinella antarctica TaxID=442734 RepID=A0ABX0X6F4_9BACT|nr:head-tail connector protein [Neolewinella antarctica]NJC24796.1 putative phiE125 gp8 family phage protein [Neolewinella antarctica]